MTNRKDYGPSIPLARLYEKVSRTGNHYLTGRLGSAKITVFKSSNRAQAAASRHRLLLTTKFHSEGSRPMPFFTELFLKEQRTNEGSDVIVVLTGRDIQTIQAMLGKAPYEIAQPLIEALLATSSRQALSGLLAAVAKACSDHHKLAEAENSGAALN